MVWEHLSYVILRSKTRLRMDHVFQPSQPSSLSKESVDKRVLGDETGERRDRDGCQMLKAGSIGEDSDDDRTYGLCEESCVPALQGRRGEQTRRVRAQHSSYAILWMGTCRVNHVIKPSMMRMNLSIRKCLTLKQMEEESDLHG